MSSCVDVIFKSSRRVTLLCKFAGKQLRSKTHFTVTEISWFSWKLQIQMPGQFIAYVSFSFIRRYYVLFMYYNRNNRKWLWRMSEMFIVFFVLSLFVWIAWIAFIKLKQLMIRMLYGARWKKIQQTTRSLCDLALYISLKSATNTWNWKISLSFCQVLLI